MSKRCIIAFSILSCLTVFLPSAAVACDLCAIATSMDHDVPKSGEFYAGLAEQFTYYGSVREDGKKVSNSAGEHLASSISQFTLSYTATEAISAQASLPYIIRRYRRIAEGGTESGSEEGIGDMSLLLRGLVINDHGPEHVFKWQIFGGVKLPTGVSDRLGEEAEEDHHDNSEVDHDHSLFVTKHGGIDHGDGPAASIHGHDLALGSGSVDVPLGSSLLYRNDRALFSGSLQYILRNEGDHDYRYGNDLLWATSAGYMVSATHTTSTIASLNLTGEWKPKDRSNGSKEDDTGISAVFFGPGVEISSDDGLNGAVALDLPLYIDNTGRQATADYRLRAEVGYKF